MDSNYAVGIIRDGASDVNTGVEYRFTCGLIEASQSEDKEPRVIPYINEFTRKTEGEAIQRVKSLIAEQRARKMIVISPKLEQVFHTLDKIETLQGKKKTSKLVRTAHPIKEIGLLKLEVATVPA